MGDRLGAAEQHLLHLQRRDQDLSACANVRDAARLGLGAEPSDGHADPLGHKADRLEGFIGSHTPRIRRLSRGKRRKVSDWD
jgi:hypothetical protein